MTERIAGDFMNVAATAVKYVKTISYFFLVAFVLVIIIITKSPLANAYSVNGQNAIDSIGQTFPDTSINYNSGTTNNPMNVGMNGPTSAVIDSLRHIAYAVDTNNNRVLVFQLNTDNSFPDYKADFVIGQSGFSQTRPNRGSGTIAANSLQNPTKISVEPTTGNVYIADAGNNRVLIFSAVMSNDPSALYVIGSASFNTNNETGVVSQNRMHSPSGIAFSGSGASLRIYITDKDFNRMLVFSQITANGQNAINVVGQSSFITSGASLSQTGLAGPIGVAVDTNSKIYVTDTNNNRIMIWSSLISSDGQAANTVLGQTWFYSNSDGVSKTALSHPQGINVDSSGELFVADSNNNRVMIWTDAITVSGQAANLVVGQTNFTSSLGGTSSTKFSLPTSVNTSGATTLVADTNNNRVLAYTSTISSNGQAASFVLGQLTTDDVVDFYGNTINNPQNKGVNGASDIAIDSIHHEMFVSDTNNNRVLVFNLDANNGFIDHYADYVIGQQTFSLTAENEGSLVGASTLNAPTALLYDSINQRLYVSDTGNNRVLIFNNSITQNDQSADIVLGQLNFTRNAPAVTATGLASPEGIAVNVSNNTLAIADRDNNRVLIWNTPPTTNGQAANYTLGQTNFTSSSFGTSAKLLHTPRGIGYDINSGYLYVADTDNNRVMIWTSSISANNQAANHVLGQSVMTSSATGLTSSQSLKKPTRVAIGWSSGVVYVTDAGNNRALVFKSAIMSDDQAADLVIGQADMTSSGESTTQNSLSNPTSTIVDSITGSVFVADTGNNRIVKFGDVTPNMPNVISPAANSTNVSSTPTFQMNSSDQDGDALQYRIEIARDSAFTVELLSYNQIVSPLGWSGQTIGNTYGLGATAAFTLPAADVLTANTSYWWRVYAYDSTGSRTWSVVSNSSKFTTASPSAIAISSIAQSITAGQPSNAITLQLRDSNNNVIKSSISTRLYLTSSSATGKYSLQSSPFSQVSYVDLPANSSSVNVYYMDSTIGNYTITVSDSSPPDGNTGLIDATQTINVTANVIASFSFSNVSNVVAGTPFTTTITAKDIYGNVVAGFAGSVSLSTALEPSSPTSVMFASGSWTGQITLTKAGNNNITASYGGVSSSSSFFTVLPSAIDSVVIAPVSPTVKSGSSTSFSASAFDIYNNKITTGLSYVWSAAASIGTVTPINQSTATLIAANNLASNTISVSVTKESTVIANTTVNIIPDHYSITAVPASTVAGSNIPVTISARSLDGSLISNANDPLVLDDTTHTVYPQSLTLTNGTWTGNLIITQASTGNKISISGYAGVITGQSSSFNITAAALFAVNASPNGISLSINTTSPVIAQAVDQYNNVVSPVAYS